MSDEDVIKTILNGATSINPILNKGDVNRVYIVTTNEGQVIVRLNESGEFSRFKKEQWCYDKVKEVGVLSPQVIDLGITKNTAYMVLNFIPGLNGEEIQDNKTDIWRELGIYAKKIHSIQADGFGDRFDDGRFANTWKGYVQYNIDSLNETDKLLELGVISQSDSEKLRDIFSNLLNKKFDFGLTHGDLSLANVIVEDEKVTLIDWGSSEMTVVPHLELMGILDNNLEENDPLFENFLAGYGMSKEDLESIRQDIVSLKLLRSVDKLRWAIDKKPEKIGEFSIKVKKLVSETL